MRQTKTRKAVRNLLVWLLTLTMVFGLLPMAAFADGAEIGVVDVDAPEATEEPAAAEQPEEPQPEEPEATEQPADAEADGDTAGEAEAQAAKEGELVFATSGGYSVVELDSGVNTASLPTGSNYRIVMLDCGRKYFSVADIKKLIDTMAQYKYNQLQLSFGNGGCRLVLDDMDLTYVDSKLTTEYMQQQIKAGNDKFNGDSSALTQAEMTEIIAYANGNGIEIIPMLNMPGHAKAIDFALTGETDDVLDISKDNVRQYAFALLKKYVDYFKSQGCNYFHFGSDESSKSGTEMSTFLSSCANIIANAGLRPRAFNDETNLGTDAIPTFVQITFWIQYSLNNSKSASALDNAGYQLINTHGNWYYTITSGTAESGKHNQYSAGVRVELPTLKKDGAEKTKWPQTINTFHDNMGGQGSVVSNNKGTMFCIWCDESTGVPSNVIISDDQSFGALYQLQELAKLYWGDELATPTPEPSATPEPTPSVTPAPTDKIEYVELMVGESKTFDTTAATGEYDTDSAYIATAKAESTAATDKHTEKVTSLDSLSADGKYLIVNDRRDKVLTGTTSSYKESWIKWHDCLELNGTQSVQNTDYWTVTKSGSGYILKYNGSNSKCLSIGNLTATLSNSSAVSLTYNEKEGYWNIFQGSYYLNALGNTDNAGGWDGGNNAATAAADIGSRWTIYEIVEAKEATGTLTITGTGEGTTKATIGGVEYTIKVTAPSTAKTVSLTYGSTYQLPANADITVKSGAEYITLENGTVTAGETKGTAVVEAVIKNAGGYVTARYTYTINVSDIDLTGVEPLSVELWVTNRYVGGTYNGTIYEATETGHIVSVSADDAYGPDGVLLEKYVPASGADEQNLPVQFWKGTRLPSDNKQTHANLSGGESKADKGSDFTKIRYYNSEWEYYYNDEWTKVLDGDQINAYYMQVYNTSPEIVTAFRDYGGIAGQGGGEYNADWFAGYRGVGTAVVYPDKSMSPDGDTEIWNNTLLCYYESTDGGHNPGLIKVLDTDEFRITKITITHGVHKDSTGKTGKEATKIWNRTTSSVEWEKKPNEAGEEWYDETTIWTNENHNVGEPIFLDDSVWGDTWKTSGIGEAFLLLFYVEPVEKDENLEIVYWDDHADEQINKDKISISVKEGVNFVNGLKQTSSVNVGTFTLDDDATIENSVGAAQKINKNITNLNGIAAKYRSGIYGYVSAEISEDGKTLTLHYNIKVTTKTFVVDFGLPVQGSLAGFGVTDNDTVEQAGFNAIYAHEFEDAYGSATMDDQYKVVYTLNKALDGKVILPLYVKFKGSDTAQVFTVTIIPASNVYYEDSFATFTGGKNTASAAQWSIKGTESKTNQALEQLGGENNNVYGYDPAYASSTKFSMGSAHKVTVSSAMLSEWNDDSAWPTASFTFKGTGFDVISLTDNRSGAIIVRVYKGNSTNGELYASYIVDNYYGYKQDSDGKWVVDTASTNCLYQIPVMQVRNLDYGEYTAEIVVFYNNAFDHTLENTSYSFWLDAIRVYNPLGENYTDYAKDGEGYPQYIKLHDYVVKNKDNLTDKVLFIDGAAEADIATYENFGPNNEVYLANGQAISFKLSGNPTEIASVQIGAKAPNGETNLNVNGDNVVETLNTATEMYYDITDAAKSGNVVTITNNSGKILSLTNIKVTFSSSATVELAAPSETDKSEAVSLVRALFAAPVVEPDPFEPSRFEAKWSDNVRQGGRAVLTVKTSEDVEQIVINGSVVVDSYRTRTERSGWGWNAKRVTYREFTYMITAQEGAEYAITAVNAEGVDSEAITAVLTVKPARPSWGWFDDLFGRWF